MFEAARLLEHVLPEDAIEQPRGSDRTHVVETAGADRRGESKRVRHALDVCLDDPRRIGGEIVDRSEMEEMVDFSLQPTRILRRDPETRL
jgi:hypothetical protein